MSDFTTRAEAEANTRYDEVLLQMTFKQGAQFGRVITSEEIEAAAKAFNLECAYITDPAYPGTGIGTFEELVDDLKAAFKAIGIPLEDEEKT